MRETRPGAGDTGEGPFDLEAAIAALRDRGQRMTRLKRAVLQQFAAGECAFTAEELGTRLGLTGDLSPLYRCLASLEQAGVLTHFYLDDGQRRYDPSDVVGTHHHHLVCSECDSVLRVDGCLLDPAAAGRLAAEGLVLHDHQLNLDGLCADCQEPDDPGAKSSTERSDEP